MVYVRMSMCMCRSKFICEEFINVFIKIDVYVCVYKDWCVYVCSCVCVDITMLMCLSRLMYICVFIKNGVYMYVHVYV